MELNGAALLDDQQPSPPESPRPTGSPRRGLFFRSAETDLEAGEGIPLLPELEDGAESVSASEWTSDESPELDESEATSSPASSGDHPLKPLSQAALKATTRKAILIATAMAHRVAAQTEGQRAVGLYIADEEDASNIGDPLASIAGRRGGVAGKVSPDTADLMSSVMGIANYVSKQVALTVQAKQVDLELAGLPPVGGPVDV